MINFTESMETLIGQLEGTGMEMLDLAQYKINQLETDKSELDELLLEQRDRIAGLKEAGNRRNAVVADLRRDLALMREDRDSHQRLSVAQTAIIDTLTARINNMLFNSNQR